LLLSNADLGRIAAGEVDLAFRRWKRPMHRAGGSQRTRAGVVAFDSVEKVSLSSITSADARRAGFGSVAELKRFLAGRPGDVYRVQLHLAGADPRVALRERADLSDDERAEIDAALARLPWAQSFLRTIAEQPEVLAATLAEQHGLPTRSFKARVRRLKELGLTESLRPGYRLSPRGRAYLGL
jgi:DNA-binding transcriptional ArsR family regulator